MGFKARGYVLFAFIPAKAGTRAAVSRELEPTLNFAARSMGPNACGSTSTGEAKKNGARWRPAQCRPSGRDRMRSLRWHIDALNDRPACRHVQQNASVRLPFERTLGGGIACARPCRRRHQEAVNRARGRVQRVQSS